MKHANLSRVKTAQSSAVEVKVSTVKLKKLHFRLISSCKFYGTLDLSAILP